MNRPVARLRQAGAYQVPRVVALDWLCSRSVTLIWKAMARTSQAAASSDMTAVERAGVYGIRSRYFVHKGGTELVVVISGVEAAENGQGIQAIQATQALFIRSERRGSQPKVNVASGQVPR